MPTGEVDDPVGDLRETVMIKIAVRNDPAQHRPRHLSPILEEMGRAEYPRRVAAGERKLLLLRKQPRRCASKQMCSGQGNPEVVRSSVCGEVTSTWAHTAPLP
jgi:hypothetical protein